MWNIVECFKPICLLRVICWWRQHRWCNPPTLAISGIHPIANMYVWSSVVHIVAVPWMAFEVLDQLDDSHCHLQSQATWISKTSKAGMIRLSPDLIPLHYSGTDPICIRIFRFHNNNLFEMLLFLNARLWAKVTCYTSRDYEYIISQRFKEMHITCLSVLFMQNHHYKSVSTVLKPC